MLEKCQPIQNWPGNSDSYFQIELPSELKVQQIRIIGRLDTLSFWFEHYEARVGIVNSFYAEPRGKQLHENDVCGYESGPGPR